MNNSTRKMPSKNKIKQFWESKLIELNKFDKNEIFDDDYCFACGWLIETERCHITAHCITQSDDVSNLHLLCRQCHKNSEHLGCNPNDLSDYWDWFMSMNQYKRAFIRALSLNPKSFDMMMECLVSNKEH